MSTPTKSQDPSETDVFSLQNLLSCHSNINLESDPYACFPDSGTWVSTVAVVFLLITSVLTCWVPKPVPLIARVKEYIHLNDENDPCCCWGRKPEDEEDGGVMKESNRDNHKGTSTGEEKGQLKNDDVAIAPEVRTLFFVCDGVVMSSW
jgi:hypothetical protein